MREYTNGLLELLEEGVLSWETVCRECLSYMAEDDVKDMAISADFIYEYEDEDEDDE